jgi:elongation factor P hydroxylase
MLDVMEISYRLDEYTNEAKGIAFDTCHKIYVLMDDEQVALQRSYGYGDEPDPDSLITSEQMTGDEMREQVMEWFNRSCGLRFISAVSTNPKFGDDGWVHIVSQFEADEEDEDEDY